MTWCRRVALLLTLMVKRIAAMRLLLAFLIVAPCALGLVAGTSQIKNLDQTLDLAVVDNAKSDASKALMTSYTRAGWRVWPSHETRARRQLMRGDLSVLVIIGPGFNAFVDGSSARADLTIMASANSLLSVTVRASTLLYAEAIRTIDTFRRSLLSQAQAHGHDPRPALRAWAHDAAERRSHPSFLPIRYINRPHNATTRSILASSYGLHALFLTVLVVFQVTAWPRPSRRAFSVYGASRLELAVESVAWLVVGILEASLSLATMALVMGTHEPFLALGALVAMNTFVLALAFALKRLDPAMGRFFGLFIAFALAVMGGVFSPVPSPVVRSFTQYTPIGWLYAWQKNLADAPPWAMAIISLVVLSLQIVSLTRRPRRAH